METVLKTCERCSEGIHTDTYFSSFLETMEIPPLLERALSLCSVILIQKPAL